MTSIHKPGRLVSYRDREWMVLPSDDPELVLLKPLGGSEAEITGVYLPLTIPGEEITEARFPLPSPEDVGAFDTAKLLFDASRLSFRNASGPFRCMGKLSFRPRAYQLVPLTMALKQDVVRLLIADDVGIGKTVEALVILRELLERGDIARFAVICPPHLCEQWQQELKDKLDIEAEIIRSSTAAALDRKLPDDRSVFFHVPYQVISIDYIKADKRRGIFLNDCPECVIVDEVHTCALPAGATSKSQQQRHALLHDMAAHEQRHLIFLTATPHSGKDSEFISLLGLLDPEFRSYDFGNIQQKQRRRIARYFIQRKRQNIRRWMKQVTPFPDRESKELAYSLSPAYRNFYEEVLQFARGISKTGERRNTARVRYWAALALLRGVMSSPAAGLTMLRNRQHTRLDEEDLQDFQQQPNPIFDRLDAGGDEEPLNVVENTDFEQQEQETLERLSRAIQNLFGVDKDAKAAAAVKVIAQWLKEGYQPIVFCKYIATAKYLGELLKEELERQSSPECQSSTLASKKPKQSFGTPKRNPVDVQVLTSELADEQRKERIDLMEGSKQRVLVATDCLSEGINLQHHFTAVLHYDLPWNPNRIEQRDGRVDRFGQSAAMVKSYLLWGEDNPIDEIVLQVLIRKVRDIQRAIGVSIPLGEDSQSMMDEVLQEVLLKEQDDAQQMQLFAEEQITNELDAARRKAENLRSIFAHEAVKPESIEQDLQEVDEAIGDVETVERFVVQAVTHLGATIQKVSECQSSTLAAKAELSYSNNTPATKAELSYSRYTLFPHNLPAHLKAHFNGKQQVLISFDSPTPPGYRYIGRNHRFVEHLCQFLLALAFEKEQSEFHSLARVAEIQTDAVSTKTVLIVFRVRNVIREAATKREVIAEEMYLWGYAGNGEQTRTLEYQEAKALLQSARSLTNLSLERQQSDLQRELQQFETLQPRFMEVATQRAEHLVEAHGRFKELVGGRRYEKVEPVLPPDVMGVYILMPKPASL